MKCLKRNQRSLQYCLYSGKQEIVDALGNSTGQYIVTYEDAVQIDANVSPATGLSNTEQFGNLENYDKVIVLDNVDCPIDENSVLFIDKEPEYMNAKTHVYVTTTNNGQTSSAWVEQTVSVPIPDYIVVRVAKSLNNVSIAIRRVEVS